MRPVVVAVAITGSAPRKRDNPALPTTPAEQIESTHEAYEAGATLTHVHVRNPDESPSSDPALFAEVMQGVRKTCPGMIVQFSTSGRGRDPAARGSALPLRPDMASLRQETASHDGDPCMQLPSARGCRQLAPQRTLTSNPVPMPGAPRGEARLRRRATRAPSTPAWLRKSWHP